MTSTIKSAEQYIKKHATDPTIKKIARKVETPEDVKKYIWNNFEYMEVYTPNIFISPDKLIERGGGSCIDFTILTGSILRAAGYPIILVIAGSRTTPKHMYLLTKTAKKWKGFNFHFFETILETREEYYNVVAAKLIPSSASSQTGMEIVQSLRPPTTIPEMINKKEELKAKVVVLRENVTAFINEKMDVNHSLFDKWGKETKQLDKDLKTLRDILHYKYKGKMTKKKQDLEKNLNNLHKKISKIVKDLKNNKKKIKEKKPTPEPKPKSTPEPIPKSQLNVTEFFENYWPYLVAGGGGIFLLYKLSK